MLQRFIIEPLQQCTANKHKTMHLIKDPDIHGFLKRNLAFLEQKEATNNLLLGVAFALSKNQNKPLPLLLLTAQNDHTPHFCCLQTIPNDLIVCATHQYLDTSIKLLIDYLENQDIKLPGIIGPKFITSALVTQWEQRLKGEWKVSMDQLIYRLDKVEQVQLSPGIFRKAEERDLAIVTPWIRQLLLDILGETQKGKAERIAKQKIEANDLYLWEDREVVSMAATTRPSRHGITINFVYTVEKHRRKGYATSCVASLSKLMLDNGYQFCSLFTDQKNSTSNNIYQQIGYRIVEKFQQIRLT